MNPEKQPNLRNQKIKRFEDVLDSQQYKKQGEREHSKPSTDNPCTTFVHRFAFLVRLQACDMFVGTQNKK